MKKILFSHKEAVKAATISSEIEGYKPITDKVLLKKVAEYMKQLEEPPIQEKSK